MADDTMMFIEVEGTLEELQVLRGIPGLDLPRGPQDLGGGRYKVRVFVTRRGAILDIQAHKLPVRVVRDEAEVKRRIEADRERIRNREGGGTTKPPASSPPVEQDDKPEQYPKGTEKP